MEDFIYQLAKELLTHLSLKELLISISDKIKDYIGAERASLFIYDPEDNTLNSVVLLADKGTYKRVEIPVSKDSIAGYTAITRKILNIKDVHNLKELMSLDKELRYHSHWLYIPGMKTKSMLSVPITKDGKLLGVFQAINKEPYFSKEDEEILKKLSPLIALAIDRAISLGNLEMIRSIEKTILDNVLESIVLISPDMKIKEMNTSFLEMIGFRFSEEEIKDKSIFEVIPALEKFKNRIDFAMENMISEEINMELLKVKIVPIQWECIYKKNVNYLALIFKYPNG
ncbi:GAF domain-containing protein [Persephonella sp.]|uniref:GAF domain-containing protein n=1 Tax=Persephonella sp. TaxID=2060922 RepID=UPI00260557F4|nr:GAF domain-containing protein [Persephonella sp.]